MHFIIVWPMEFCNYKIMLACTWREYTKKIVDGKLTKDCGLCRLGDCIGKAI
jgi:hypothetical protein